MSSILKHKKKPLLIKFQDRLSLAKDKKELKESWNTVLCVSCRTPIKDTGPGEPENRSIPNTRKSNADEQCHH